TALGWLAGRAVEEHGCDRGQLGYAARRSAAPRDRTPARGARRARGLRGAAGNRNRASRGRVLRARTERSADPPAPRGQQAAVLTTRARNGAGRRARAGARSSAPPEADSRAESTPGPGTIRRGGRGRTPPARGTSWRRRARACPPCVPAR